VPLLGPEDGRLLLRVARLAIGEALQAPDNELARALTQALERDPLRRHGAAFVSLHLAMELRGCLGTLEPSQALARTVARHAVGAALEDPRFSPLRPHELPAVSLSVSVLGPLTPVASAEAIVVGRHGVSFVRGDLRSVFLPQVALDQGWDVRTLLENLALKAGLRCGDWETASLAVFETESFEEAIY
jgi:AmmeMemoRadiSam system protein A